MNNGTVLDKRHTLISITWDAGHVVVLHVGH